MACATTSGDTAPLGTLPTCAHRPVSTAGGSTSVSVLPRASSRAMLSSRATPALLAAYCEKPRAVVRSSRAPMTYSRPPAASLGSPYFSVQISPK